MDTALVGPTRVPARRGHDPWGEVAGCTPNLMAPGAHLTCAASTAPSPPSPRAHSRRRGSPRPSLLPRNCHQGWNTEDKKGHHPPAPLQHPHLFPRSNIRPLFTSPTRDRDRTPRNQSAPFTTVPTEAASPCYLGLTHPRNSGATVLLLGVTSP